MQRLALDHSFRVRPARRRRPPTDVLARRHPPARPSAPDGTPTPANPDYSLATPGAAPIGVPNFFIDKFRIPPFLLPVYQAAGIEYGVRWEVLAAINEIETDYGRNLNVSSAGALGWMQFMPATWKQYGVDANRDGLKDPYNPVDAIFAAARYLRAAGAETDVRRAIFAYNHADWYVDSVLMRARLIGGLPSNFVGSLTGLTQGRFPVHAKATYAGQVEKRDTKRKTKAGHNAALVVEADQHRRGIEIFARRGAPVVAVNDGRIVRMGETKRLGRFIQLQDTYGNTYTYGRLGQHPQDLSRAQAAQDDQGEDRRGARAAERRRQADRRRLGHRRAPAPRRRPRHAPRPPHASRAPSRTAAARAARRGARQAAPVRPPVAPERAGRGRRRAARRTTAFGPSDSAPIGLDARDFVTKPLKKGSRVVGRHDPRPHRQDRRRRRPRTSCSSSARPAAAPRASTRSRSSTAGSCSSRPRSTAPRARTRSSATTPSSPSLGQILLMGKDALSRHVLANPRIDIYSCGARDIRSGAIDRRVLATLEFLAASGLKPTVTSLKCGHGFLTSSGNVSQHSSGNAVDIAMVNGIPIVGHQGKGSITDLTIQRLLTLQGTMKPDQIISLMTFEGADNTLALADHYDHIHVGWKPLYGTELEGRQAGQRGAQAQAVDQADRPPEGDRQPGGQPPAVEVSEGERVRAAEARDRHVSPVTVGRDVGRAMAGARHLRDREVRVVDVGADDRARLLLVLVADAGVVGARGRVVHGLDRERHGDRAREQGAVAGAEREAVGAVVVRGRRVGPGPVGVDRGGAVRRPADLAVGQRAAVDVGAADRAVWSVSSSPVLVSPTHAGASLTAVIVMVIVAVSGPSGPVAVKLNWSAPL